MSLQESQERVLKQFENILNKETLKMNISLSALFVLFFESLKDFIIDRPRDFYWNDFSNMEDEKLTSKESESYKQKVKPLDKKIFPASVRWFQNLGALSEDDATIIFKAEKRRNEFVHELLKVISEGCTIEDAQLLSDLIAVYRKIDSWWIYNIEFDSDDVPEPEQVTQDDCCGITAIVLQIIKDMIIDNDKQYSGLLEQFRAIVQKQREQNTELFRQKSKNCKTM